MITHATNKTLNTNILDTVLLTLAPALLGNTPLLASLMVSNNNLTVLTVKNPEIMTAQQIGKYTRSPLSTAELYPTKQTPLT